jgi:hypothetical protein
MHPSVNPVCLFIAPLKGEDTDTRERTEDVYASVVVPAAERAGYRPRPTMDDEPGTILERIFKDILSAHVVIADVTDGNFSVGYELGFTHSRAKNTILLHRNTYAIPYDVRGVNCVPYDYTNRRSLRGAVDPLAEQLRRLRGVSNGASNPILNALRSIPHIGRVEAPPGGPQPPPLRNLENSVRTVQGGEQRRLGQGPPPPPPVTYSGILSGMNVDPPPPLDYSPFAKRISDLMFYGEPRKPPSK